MPVAWTPTTTVSPTTTLPPPTLSPTVTPRPANTARLPEPGSFTWQEIADGFDQPLGLVSAMDGSGRLFVVEKTGRIRVIQDGRVLPELFLDLRDRVRLTGSTTRGLLGLVFHPRFAQNRSFFVHYTDQEGDSRIARYFTTDDLAAGDPASEAILLEVTPPIGEHNGGDLAFGPDGYLYIAFGDGGGPGDGDRAGNAQNKESLLGKLLRLDVDGGEPYGIPAGNPFASGGGRPEIWASGLRNPWRFTFDPLTGDLYIADVGENSWEEINILPRGSPGGANFGWNYREGTHRFQGQPDPSLTFIDPVIEYDHTQGCSVTGGRVYHGAALPEWFGVYLYGDFCQGKVWGLLRGPEGTFQNALLFETGAFLTSFGQDEAGEVYLVSISGSILKLVRKEAGK